MRKTLILVLMLIGASVLASAASATTLVNGYTGQPLTGNDAHWLAESKMPTPTGQIAIYPDSDTAAECLDPLVVACSEPGIIWTDGGLNWRSGFMHEIGHEWDFDHMGPDPMDSPALEPWQQKFEQIWQITPGWGWWDAMPGDGKYGYPGEWFASAYQECADHGIVSRPPWSYWNSGNGFPGYSRIPAMTASCVLIKEVSADPDAWVDAS